jgi:outer membrane protein, heavy metal efflux system
MTIFRAISCAGLAAAAGGILAGCVAVRPQPDYQRAVGMVAERTGVENVYAPETDAEVDTQVAAILTDGLTAEEAVQVALLNNRGFQALFQSIGASRADVVQSGLLSNPTLALSVRFPEGGGRSDLTLGLAQELVDLWQIPVRKRVAEAELEQTVLAVLQRAIELTAEVRSDCYRLLALERADALARENLALAERTLKIAQDRFNNGEVSQLDVRLVRTQWLEVRQTQIALARDHRLAELALGKVLGLTRWTQPWALTDTLGTRTSAIEDEDALVELAIERRADLRAADIRLRGAEAELERQFLNVFPHVALGFELERLEIRPAPGRKVLADTARASVAAGQLTAPDLQSRGQRRLERSQIIDALLGPTLELTLPIWDQNQAQIAKARFHVLQQRREYEDLLDAVAEQVREAAVAARSAEELVRFFEDETLRQATENVDNARDLYQSGEQSVIVLLEAQDSLMQQRRSYVDALRDQAVALADLERAIGGRRPAVAATQPATGDEHSR